MSFYTFYRRWGNTVLVREKQDDVDTKNVIVELEPTIWERDPSFESGYTDYYGTSLKPKSFSSAKDASQFLKSYKGVEGVSFCGTSDFALEEVCNRYGKIEYDKSKIRTLTLDIEVNADEFPNPEEAKYPVDLLTVHDNITDTYVCLSLYDFDSSDPMISHLNVVHKKFDSEHDLLVAFVQFWASMNADNFTGWNTEIFDIPYLYFRICKVLGETWAKKLSPFESVFVVETTVNFGNEVKKIDIVGMTDLDYISLYKKHRYLTRESYRLGFIAQAEGVGNKVAYSNHNLQDLARENPQLYQVYNIVDVELVVELDRKLKYLDITYALSYLTMSNYADTLGTTRLWTNAIYSYLYLDKKQIPPVFPNKELYREFPGGFVMEPKAGKYRWVVSFDFASLYPHLIMHQNLGPETWVSRSDFRQALMKSNDQDAIRYAKSSEFDCDIDAVSIDTCVNKEVSETLLHYAKTLNLCVTPNGSLYRRDFRSFLSEMMQFYYNQRKVVKKEMLALKQKKVDATTEEDKKFYENAVAAKDAMQMALKIAMNSGYGAISNKFFQYFKIDVAEAITTGGQTAVRWASRDIDEFLMSVLGDTKSRWIYSDTDSSYVDLSDIVNRYTKFNPKASTNDIVTMLDKFCETRIQPVINQSCENLREYLNGYDQKLFMKREAIAEVAIWSSKKHYAMAVWDNEGVRYYEPDLKVQGLESVKSSTPKWAREYLKKVYMTCLLKDQEALFELFRGVKVEYQAMPVETIAVPRGVNGIKKYSDSKGMPTVKGVQAHIRGSIYHNAILRKLEIKSIPPIADKEKIRYIMLKPNHHHVDVIAFREELPPEFKLHQYVDRETIFQKSFVSPAESFAGLIGWDLEFKPKLEEDRDGPPQSFF